MGFNEWGCEDGKTGDVSSMEIWWWINIRAALIALIFITVFHFSKKFYVNFHTAATSSSSHSSSSSLLSSAHHLPSASSPIPDGASRSRNPEIVSDSDLKFLIDNLDEKHTEDEKWENVIEKKNNFLSYKAKCCKPKDRPLKYLSTTVFQSCSPELLRDFYMDNDYRKEWDKTVVDHMQLQVDETNGIEIGRTIKKFPLLTPREYILAWRLWEGNDRTFYCFIKECEHSSAPRQKKFVRVEYFRSGWQIRKVPGTDASEIRLFHQEDAGINVEMAKLAFAKGIWSYLCKMDNALRNFSAITYTSTGPPVSAATFIQKVPPEIDAVTGIPPSAVSESVAVNDDESWKKTLLRRPSKKFVANSLLVLGGVIYLSRAHSALGAKVTLSYILTKLRKRGDSSSQRCHS